MGGLKTTKVRTRPAWLRPVELSFGSVFLGVGLFEAFIFMLSTMQSNLSMAVKLVGFAYFVLPYGLLQASSNIPSQVLSLKTWQKIIGLAVLNVPFLWYLAIQGSQSANIILATIVLASIAFSAPYVRLRTVPVLDVLCVVVCMSGPFLYGVFLSGSSGSWWLAAWLTGSMIIAANYFMYKLPTIGLEARTHTDGTAVRLGVDKMLSVVLGLYISAAILPAIAYGWHGVIAGALLLWYVVVALQAIPFRLVAGSAGLYRVWRAVWFVNYPIGVIVLAYAWFILRSN